MRIITSIMAAAVLVCSTVSAQAGLMGLGKTAFRAAGVAGVNQQLERNLWGDGWTYNYAANYFDEVFDFGTSELVLNGSLGGTAGFTTRGIPDLNFSMQTGAAGMTYDYECGCGLEKVSVTNGNVVIDADVRINTLGCYTVDVEINNRGELVAEGLYEDTKSLNFDLGPVSLEGFIWIDMINSMFGTDLPGGSDNFTAVLGDKVAYAIEQANAGAEMAIEHESPDGIIITPAVVPEPASIAVLASGMVLMAIRRRR